MARLVAGDSSIQLNSGKVTLGESPDVDIPLRPGLELAPVHIELRPLLGGYVLEHLGGSHHTAVNGTPVERLRSLASGDVLQLGKVELTFLFDEAPAAQQQTIDDATSASQDEAQASTAAAPPPAATDLPPPPENLAPPPAEASDNEGTPAAELPPLPSNLAPPPAEASDTEDSPAAELPPLPANLATPPAEASDTEDSPAAELPPLPANLATPPAEASVPDDQDPAPSLANHAPSPGKTASTGEPPSIPSEDVQAAPQAKLDASSGASLPGTLKLAAQSDEDRHQRKRPPIIEYALPGIFCILAITGGVVFLLHHNKNLGLATPEPGLPAEAPEAPIPAEPTQSAASVPFMQALGQLQKESEAASQDQPNPLLLLKALTEFSGENGQESLTVESAKD